MTDVAPYVKRLLDLPENEFCADCQKPHPTWASTTFGVFICINCSGIHRNLGTHITLVRSVTLDTWTTQQYKVMKKVGNVRANDYYEAKLKNGRPSSTDRQSMERFIYDKYVQKLFAADGPPPHISCLIPSMHQDNNVNHQNKTFNTNHKISNSENGHQNPAKHNDLNNKMEPNALTYEHHLLPNTSNNHDFPHHSKHCSQSCSQPKFARPLNFVSDDQETNKAASQSNDFALFNEVLSASEKNACNCVVDDKYANKSNYLYQNDDFVKSDGSTFVSKLANPQSSDNIDENDLLDEDKNQKLSLAKNAQKSNIKHLLDVVGIQNESEIAKKSEKTNADDNRIGFAFDMETDEKMIEKSESDNSNNCEEVETEKKKVLPKFAKKKENEQETVMDDSNSIANHQPSEVFVKLNNIQDKKVKRSKSESKKEVEEELIFVNPGIEEGEQNPIEYENYINIEQPNIPVGKTKSLPKFARKKDDEQNNNELNENIKLDNSNNSQSSEVFNMLNQVQDKKTQQQKEKSKVKNSKSKQKTEKIEDLVFINPGVENEEDPILVNPKIESEEEQNKKDIDNENQTNNLKQNNFKIERAKSLPKFAKKKEDGQENDEQSDNVKLDNSHNVGRNQSNEVLNILSRFQDTNPQKPQVQEIIGSKLKKKTEKVEEEELIFINPGIEEKEKEQNQNEIKIDIEIEHDNDLNRNEPLERAKSLPKFAKKKDDESENNELSENQAQSSELFATLNNLNLSKSQQPQIQKITNNNNSNIRKSLKKKEKKEEEEILFINPGVEEEEEQKQQQQQIQYQKIDVESNKSLPKFAKKKDDESENNELSENQNQSSELFAALNNLNANKTPQPQIQKITSNNNINIHKSVKQKENKEEEEIFFINPGVEEEEQQQQQKQQQQIQNQKIDVESNKSLPKFAKKKGEEGDNDNHSLEENGEIFSVLSQMKKKTEDPILLKNISKANKPKKTEKRKEQNEEELIFINPGTDEYIETEILINDMPNQNNDNEEQNTEEQSKKKVLPKFAKMNEENETDNEIQALNNSNNDQSNNLVFKVLNHLK